MSMQIIQPKQETAFQLLDMIMGKDVSHSPEDEQTNWLNACGNILGKLGEIEDAAVMGQDRVLYRVDRVWKMLSSVVTSRWGYSFHDWARAYMIQRGDDPLANTTINNRVRVYRDFVSVERVIELPAEVEMPYVDEETGEVTTIKIEPDINKAGYSKLLSISKIAKEGNDTPELWNGVFDPNVPHSKFVEDVKEADVSGRYKQPESKEDIRNFNFDLQDNYIVVHFAQRTVRLAELRRPIDIDEEEYTMFMTGLNYMLTPIGIDNPLAKVRVEQE